MVIYRNDCNTNNGNEVNKMIEVKMNGVTVYDCTAYTMFDIEVYDRNNDFYGYIKKEDINNYIECLYMMYDKRGSRDSIRTDGFIKEECKGFLEAYKGNWIITGRIPIIIKALEEFSIENGIGKLNKEKILKEINSMGLHRLHELVRVIKRKEKANETSRN